MSYFKTTEYRIIPKESFPVLRSCSGCGEKTRFLNTKRFRVNANGNKLDIWLIYQCEKCKHTLNLTVYERQKAASVPEEEYKRFLRNDEELAEEYGRNFRFFKKNKIVVDSDGIVYNYRRLREAEDESSSNSKARILIQNPYELKIRMEKQIGAVLGLSRSQVNRLLGQQEITVENSSTQFISFTFDSHILEKYYSKDRI